MNDAKQINLFTKRTNAPKANGTPETQIQAAFFAWLKLHSARFPQLSFCFAIPNGGFRFKSTAAMMRRTGTKPGVPDCFLPVPSKGCCGLWIEFKTDKGKLSDNQTAFVEFLQTQRYKVLIVRSWTDGANCVIDYLNLPLSKM